MSLATSSHVYGIGLIAVIVGAAIGVSYYQFYYIPELDAIHSFPNKILHPGETTIISIVSGSINQDQQQNFVLKKQSVQLGVDNLVVWKNNDDAVHFVTPLKPFKDIYSGDFGSNAITSGKTYSFLFTQEGNIMYICKVHPWMTGEIDVVPGALTS